MTQSNKSIHWHDDELSLLNSAIPDPTLRENVLRLFEEKHDALTTTLKASEAQFRKAINLQDDLVCRYNRHYILTFVNEAYARHHNIPPEKLIGTNFVELLAEDIKPWARGVVTDMLTNPRPVRQTLPVTQPDGTVLWYDWSDTPILNEWGEVIEVQAIGRNITQIKELELLASQQEAKLRLIMEHIPMGAIIIFDHDLRYTFASGGALKDIGILSSDLEGLTLNETIPKEDYERLEAIHRQTLAGDRIETEMQIGDRVFSGVTAPIYDKEGEITGGIVSLYDITARKKLDQENVRLQIEQEQKRIIIDFIRDASHEFRTPLTIMQSSLYIMEKTDDIDKIHARTQKISTQIQYLAQLIDALVMMARLDSNAQTEDIWQINIEFIIRSAFERLHDKIESRTITYDLEKIPDTYANHNDIALALGEIAKNAIDATTPADGKIDVSMRLVDNNITITIADNGMGISDEDLQMIWKRFFRGNTSHLKRGFGLGLPIAQRIIHLHNGDIQLTSTLHQGTTVTITFPLVTNPDDRVVPLN